MQYQRHLNQAFFMNTAKSNAISDFFAPLIEGRTLAEIPPLVELAKKITHHKFRRGTIIFNKGDTLTGVFLVVSGQIKLTIPSCQGHDKVIDVIEPGNSFGVWRTKSFHRSAITDHGRGDHPQRSILDS